MNSTDWRAGPWGMQGAQGEEWGSLLNIRERWLLAERDSLEEGATVSS